MTSKSIFDHLDLSPELNSAIAALGFEEATPIQAQAIPLMLKGKDIIGQAQTGTGKTIAFGVPLIESIDANLKATQAVVLCPTRELAIQVAEEFGLLLKYKRQLHALPIYGGQQIDKQFKALRKGAQIIIATPGRLIDHLQRKTVDLSTVKFVVLDEADIMLDMGFRDDIETILKKTPKEKQTVFFSATMPPSILQLTKKYLSSPEHIKVVHKEVTVPSINQNYYELKQGMKLDALTRLLDHFDPKLSLVFCNTKRAVDELVKHLHTRGYLAIALHGDMRQSKRDNVMKKFRSGQIDILVATDVAARGIDVDEIDAVFNYDMPQDEEYYVHRIGRTARAGRTGAAHTFVMGKEISKLRDIERYTKSKIALKQLPGVKEKEQKSSTGIEDEIRLAIGDGKEMAKYEKLVLDLMEEDLTTLDIAAALLKMKMKDSKPAVNSEKVSHHVKIDERPKERPLKVPAFTGGRSGNRSYRLFINVGRKSKVNPKDITRLFTVKAGIPNDQIIDIDIYDKFSFVEINGPHVDKAISVLNGMNFKDKKLAVNIAKKK